MVLFLVSLIAGALTVLAPCILPLLPVIVGSSVAGERNLRRAFIVIGSLAISVVVFTLLLKASTAFINIPPSVWTYLSGGIVLFFGVTLLFPGLWERLPFIGRLGIGANRLVGAGYQKQSLTGDIVIGAALGPVFSTCSPTYFIVLATVLPENLAVGLLYLFAYVAGLSAMLLLVALVGQRLADRLGVAADPRGTFKRVLGILFILVGLVIVTGYDKKIQVQLLDWGVYDVTKIEQWLLQMTDGSAGSVAGTLQPQTILDDSMRVAKKENLYQRAPDIQKPAGYINTGFYPNGSPKALTLAQLREEKKVVLLDIWTYSCINCQRTLPYLKAWYEKYKDQGLEIVGIHTPEFAFEKDLENVQWAVQQFGLTYPNVLDNDYATWRALSNNYWPRKYLVDIDGFIVYDHIGEGSYEETEKAIQRALAERAAVLGEEAPDSGVVAETIAPVDLSGVASPEIYFGSERNNRIGNGEPGWTGERTFEAPQTPARNQLYLEGRWNVTPEYAESRGSAKIIFKYRAKNVYMVAHADSPVTIRVLRDGEPVGKFAGDDIDATTATGAIQENRLYKLIHDSESDEHLLEIEIEGTGLEVYTFTFG